MTHGDADQALAEQARLFGGVEKVFSQKVRDYQLARPDYPDAVFDTLTDIGALSAGAAVADLGAGTGLLTRGFLARGHRVFAIEPNDEMRLAADALLGQDVRYTSRAGSAEDSGLDDGCVALVTAAQAFHWFDVRRARIESLRILSPSGMVALIWNDRLMDDPLNRALEQVLNHYGGSRRLATVATEERRHVPAFFGGGPFSSFVLPHTQRLSNDGLAALVFSRSYMPARDSQQGMAAERDTQGLFDRFAIDGQVLMHYRTLMIVGRPA